MKGTSGQAAKRLDKGVEVSTLCAYYGGMLTDRQREALRLHYDEDLSLGEIAEQLNVTRQNVHELITRSEQKLRRMENELGGVKRAQACAAHTRQAISLMQSALSQAAPMGVKQDIAGAMALMGQVLAQQEGEENDHGI